MAILGGEEGVEFGPGKVELKILPARGNGQCDANNSLNELVAWLQVVGDMPEVALVFHFMQT